MPPLSQKRSLPILVLLTVAALCLWGKSRLETRLAPVAARGPSLYLRHAHLHAVSLKRHSLGFQNALADLLWIRLLQSARHEKLEEGKVSWEFAQLNAITQLDPRFPQAYPFGAAYLSVFLQDKLGARTLLERWATRYPRYWRAHYYLAYHLYFEMGEYDAASRYMLRAAELPGAPAWLTALGVRLLSQTGSLAESLRLAVQLYPALSQAEAKDRMRTRIRSLRYHLQLTLWNEALERYLKGTGRPPSSLEALRSSPFFGDRNLASLLENTAVTPELAPLFSERFAFQYDPRKRKIVPARSYPELEEVGIHRPDFLKGS